MISRAACPLSRSRRPPAAPRLLTCGTRFCPPPLLRRLRLSSVCQRWQAVILSAPLLAQVAIRAVKGSGIDLLRGASSWLVRRAAGSMQQLSLDVADMALMTSRGQRQWGSSQPHW